MRNERLKRACKSFIGIIQSASISGWVVMSLRFMKTSVVLFVLFGWLVGWLADLVTVWFVLVVACWLVD